MIYVVLDMNGYGGRWPHVDSLWTDVNLAINRANQIAKSDNEVQVEEWPTDELKNKFNVSVVYCAEV